VELKTSVIQKWLLLTAKISFLRTSQIKLKLKKLNLLKLMKCSVVRCAVPLHNVNIHYEMRVLRSFAFAYRDVSNHFHLYFQIKLVLYHFLKTYQIYRYKSYHCKLCWMSSSQDAQENTILKRGNIPTAEDD